MKTGIPVFSAFLLIAFSSHAVSQASQEAPLELDDLIVTALLSPVERSEVAGSLTVFSREDIEQRQAKYLSDLLRTVPGFAVSQSGGPGTQTQVRVRGSEANHVLVLLDGVRVNDPASADEYQFQYALSSDIERIEIMRGPQSATWGTDALSAVINIIRSKADDGPGMQFSAEAGSFGTSATSLSGSRSGEAKRFWGGVSRLDTDGTNISRKGSERDGSENTSLDLGASFDIGRGTNASFTGRYVDSVSEFDDIDFFVTGLPVDAANETRASRTYLQGKLEYRPVGSAWSGRFSVSGMDSENDNFANDAWTGSTAAETLEMNARASVILGDTERRNHQVNFALDRQNIDFSQRGLESFFGDPNQDQGFDVTGFAIEYQGRPNENLSWSVSGRQDQFSDFDDASTWQLSASQRLRNGLRLRGSVGTGSKAPTFTERFGFYEGSFVGNPDLKPESSSGWELGIESMFFNDRFNVELAYFDRELEDEINGFVFDPASGLFTAGNKLNPSERQGFELLGDARLGSGWSIGFSYTRVDASEVDFAGNPVTEVRRPEHEANINANYSFADMRGNVNVNVDYTGNQFDLFFSPVTFLSEQVVLTSHTVVNLAGSWELSPKLELFARVENLFDEEYEEVLGFARPGRAAYAGLRGNFTF